MIDNHSLILLPDNSVFRHLSIFPRSVFAQIIDCCNQCEVTVAVFISTLGSDYDELIFVAFTNGLSTFWIRSVVSM